MVGYGGVAFPEISIWESLIHREQMMGDEMMGPRKRAEHHYSPAEELVTAPDTEAMR